MARQANKVAVGAFVVVTVLLAVAALILVGSGSLFGKSLQCVLVFENPVTGLGVGSPVIFRGVKIGQVSRIYLLADPRTGDMSIPVFVDIDLTKIYIDHGTTTVADTIRVESDKRMGNLVEKGLRGRLTVLSIVTGQLAVELDYFPDIPARFKGGTDVLEIPTAPSALDQLESSLKEIPIREIGQNVSQAAESLTRLAESKALTESLDSLNATLKSVQAVADSVAAQTPEMVSRVERTLDSYDRLARTLDAETKLFGDRMAGALDQVHGLTKRTNTAAERLSPLFTKADDVLAKTGAALSENSELMVDLKRALKELSAASRALRTWADYLERHPEALIKGKGDKGK